MIIYSDGTADICRAKGNLQSVINPNHEDYDKSKHVSLSFLGVDQAAVNNNQFILTTRKGELYHGIVEERTT
jgi:hypothetical protein